MANLIGQSLGRYHIREKLGEGGMATVYKAYDTHLETDVAVKVIRTENILPSTLERTLKRFEREAKMLARLTHPNIVKVTDFGEYDGKPYLVMPHLSGGTLKKRLGKPMEWQGAVQLLLPIARALDYAHRQNMIHRDVKPSNILITADGEPMLTDFGIAKVLDLEETADLTGTGMGIGTPEYMAPEQWTGQTSPQSDLYSLGVVLYEMITGRKPYTAQTPAAILLKQATEPLPRPSGLVTNLPDKVEKILIKALARDPKERHKDISEFTKAIENNMNLSGLPVERAEPGADTKTVEKIIDTMATADQDWERLNTPHSSLQQNSGTHIKTKTKNSSPKPWYMTSQAVTITGVFAILSILSIIFSFFLFYSLADALKLGGIFHTPTPTPTATYNTTPSLTATPTRTSSAVLESTLTAIVTGTPTFTPTAHLPSITLLPLTKKPTTDEAGINTNPPGTELPPTEPPPTDEPQPTEPPPTGEP